MTKENHPTTNKHFNIDVVKAETLDFDAAFIISATSLDRDKDTIDKSALKSIAQTKEKLIALWQHKHDEIIGYWANFSFDGSSLKSYIKFASTPISQYAKTLINDGVPLGASIGFRAFDGEKNAEGGYHFKGIDLFECSIVSVPANPVAYQVAKSMGIDHSRITFEQSSNDDQLVNQMKIFDAKNRAAAAIKKATSLLSNCNPRG